MRRHTSWHLWLILASNICMTLILVFTQYWSVLSTHHHDDASVVLFELMLQRVYIISLILKQFSHIERSSQAFSVLTSLILCYCHFCAWTKKLFICKERTNNRKNSLLSSYTVSWLVNSEASACETSCLQSTVSAAGLSNLTMLHSQWTDSWLPSSLSVYVNWVEVL
jgi:hypothetical protein